MLMTFKNKYIRMLQHMVNDAEKAGYVPDKIYIELNEAIDLLKEIVIYSKENKSVVEQFDIQSDNWKLNKFTLFKCDRLDSETRSDLLKSWYNKSTKITFEGIELVINKQKKQKPNEEYIE